MDITSFILGFKKGKASGGGGGGGIQAEVLEELPIGLDFTEGNQRIEAPDGTLVKSAVLLKPDNLKPENIAEGVDIAGIIGTFASGGGGSGGEMLLKTGSWKPADETVQTIEHGLGVVPDFVLVHCNTTAQLSALPEGKSYILMGGGTTSALADKGLRSFYALYKDGYLTVGRYGMHDLAGNEEWLGIPYGATATTFNVGASPSGEGVPLMPDKTYYWVAIKF